MWPGMARRHTGQAVGMRWVACLSLLPLATLIQSGSRPSRTMKHLLQVLPLALRRCLQATVFVCQPTPLLAICRPISPSICYLVQPIISSAILYKLGMSSCKSAFCKVYVCCSLCVASKALSVPPDQTLLEPPVALSGRVIMEGTISSEPLLMLHAGSIVLKTSATSGFDHLNGKENCLAEGAGAD